MFRGVEWRQKEKKYRQSKKKEKTLCFLMSTVSEGKKEDGNRVNQGEVDIYF